MLDDDVRQTHPIKDNLGRTQHIKAYKHKALDEYCKETA
jgi:hypothetical protein